MDLFTHWKQEFCLNMYETICKINELHEDYELSFFSQPFNEEETNNFYKKLAQELILLRSTIKRATLYMSEELIEELWIYWNCSMAVSHGQKTHHENRKAPFPKLDEMLREENYFNDNKKELEKCTKNIVNLIRNELLETPIPFNKIPTEYKSRK